MAASFFNQAALADEIKKLSYDCSGIIAITHYNNDMAVGEDKIIDRFWATLKLKKQ